MTLEVLIEQDRFNNSLAGELNCPNAWHDPGPDEAIRGWKEKYLQDGKTPYVTFAS